MSDQVLVSNTSTKNWIAMVERIKEEIQRSASVDEVAIKRAICDSIGYYKSHNFRFNDGSATLTTVENQDSYPVESVPGQGDGYPADVIEFRQILSSYSSTFERLPFMPHSRYLRDQSVHTSTGHPDYYTFYEENLIFFPSPNKDLLMTIYYLKDIGSPSYAHVDGGWVFNAPDGTTIGNSYTSAWFDEAETLIRARAKWDIYVNVIHDFAKAQVMQAVIGTETARLRKEMRAVNPFNAEPCL